MVDPIQFDLNNSVGYKYILQTALGKKFKVDLPVGVANAYFFRIPGETVNHRAHRRVFAGMQANIEFGNVVGTSPQVTYNNFSITQNKNDAILCEIEGGPTSRVGFDSITIKGYYGYRSFAPTAQWYDPLSYGVPFGTKDIYPKSETFVLFGYHTSDGIDPGPFLSIV